jgi:large subunit ribosomal protein L31
MKKDIHPKYEVLTVQLTDGTEITTRSTMKVKDGSYRAEVDSRNHPFYIGAERMISTDGRVDRFNKRYGKK